MRDVVHACCVRCTGARVHTVCTAALQTKVILKHRRLLSFVVVDVKPSSTQRLVFNFLFHIFFLFDISYGQIMTTRNTKRDISRYILSLTKSEIESFPRRHNT